MGRLIDANLLVKQFLTRYTEREKQGNYTFVACEIKSDFRDMMDEMPTVDAVPVVHSRPVQVFNDPCTGRMITTCMMCDGKVSKKDAYCKHCGARMDLERSKDENRTE